MGLWVPIHTQTNSIMNKPVTNPNPTSELVRLELDAHAHWSEMKWTKLYTSSEKQDPMVMMPNNPAAHVAKPSCSSSNTQRQPNKQLKQTQKRSLSNTSFTKKPTLCKTHRPPLQFKDDVMAICQGHWPAPTHLWFVMVLPEKLKGSEAGWRSKGGSVDWIELRLQSKWGKPTELEETKDACTPLAQFSQAMKNKIKRRFVQKCLPKTWFGRCRCSATFGPPGHSYALVSAITILLHQLRMMCN